MKEPRKSPPKSRTKSEEKLNEELQESFPASDPPANTTPTTAGGPEPSLGISTVGPSICMTNASTPGPTNKRAARLRLPQREASSWQTEARNEASKSCADA